MRSHTKPPSNDPRTFEDIARKIAGANAPPWLAEHLRRWSPSLFLDHHVEAIQPTKSAMKGQLAAVGDAALLLGRALTDTSTREFLEISGRIENTLALVNPLLDVAGAAERASASPALSTEAGKTRAGRGRAVPPNTFPAKVFCAALIAETWAYFHNCYPSPQNREAAAAADAYWRASGGKVTGWGDDPLTGWRPYFTKAQASATGMVRKECRRHLIEAARRG